MKLQFFCAVIISISCIACSTIEYAQVNNSLKGKKVGVYAFDLTLSKKHTKKEMDTVCFCNGQAASEAMSPFLLTVGLKVTSLYSNQKVSIDKALQRADSLQLDYILVGNGIIEMQGKSSFMQSLNVKLINVQSKETHMVTSFSGVAIRPAKAGIKIGKKIQLKLK